MYTCFLMRDEKEERKKQARSNKQTRQSNTAHVHFCTFFVCIHVYFSKPLRLLYSLIIYKIVNFSFFALYSLLLLSFFLYLKSVPIHVIVHVHVLHSTNYPSIV